MAVNDIDKRVMKLEASSKQIENEITQSDDNFELLEQKSLNAINILNKKSNVLKSRSNNINQNIIKSVSIIKHLAHQNDFKLLKEKLKYLKIDEQVNDKDIKNMVIDRLNIEKNFI